MDSLPTSPSTQITPIRCSALPFFSTGGLTNVKSKAGYWYEVTSYFRWKPTVDINGLYNYAAQILRPQNTESGEPELKDVEEKSQDKNELIIHNTILY